MGRSLSRSQRVVHPMPGAVFSGCLLLSFAGSLLCWGCTREHSGARQPSAVEQPSEDALVYHLTFPADLDHDMKCRDKQDNVQVVSRAMVHDRYAAMHRRGWRSYLLDYAGEWNPSAGPVCTYQCSNYEAAGYSRGYQQCKTEVSLLEGRLGRDKTLSIVRRARQNYSPDQQASARAKRP